MRKDLGEVATGEALNILSLIYGAGHIAQYVLGVLLLLVVRAHVQRSDLREPG